MFLVRSGHFEQMNKQMIQIITIVQQSITSTKVCLTIQLLCLQKKSNHVFHK